MAKLTTSELKRDAETLHNIQRKLLSLGTKMSPVREQEEVLADIEAFFQPEIEEAVNYTGKLPSFRNCGGLGERKQLLKEEAKLVILSRLMVEPEEYEDFEAHLQKFREDIRKTLNLYTQQAQRESLHVSVKKDKKTNENEQCTIISGGKDITDEACNPNWRNDTDSSESADDFMEFNMGQYQSF